ncbi:membrane protease YdiL (CAAX protease family) [Mycetocola sp. CAN_C7]|uniref:CPBP family intramembrane glutamic endopeptidase n=1 Tax=Mycetocola sp. CAN_C7 TaxID=2787724 RepID=UPI0018CB6EB9
MGPTQPARDIRQRWMFGEVVLGLAGALSLAAFLSLGIYSGALTKGNGSQLFGYLAVWVPLLGAVLYATYRRGQCSLRLDFGLRSTWLDILFGLTLGFFLRSIATLVEILIYGRAATGGATFGPTVYDIWWVLLAVLAPVVIAPVIEELFFRGLLLRAVMKASARSTATSSRIPAVIAIGVSSLVFAAVHMLQTGGGAPMAVVGISTLVVGIGLGTLAAVTARLGGPIIAHVTFNGLGVLATLL